MDFLKHLNWFTIVSGLLTVAGAVITFILARLDQHDKRKSFLRLKSKAIKDYAAYLTLLFAFLTLFVQSRHDYMDAEEKRLKEKAADQKQQKNLILTLKTIDSTLSKQQTTQDSMQRVLNSQKAELHNEAKLIDSINSNLGLSYKTQRTVNSLNFPIGNTVGASCWVRVYVKGFSALWKDSTDNRYVLLRPNQNIEQMIDRRVSNMTQTRIIPYWRFFFSCSQNGFDHTMAITAKTNRIVFNPFAGVDAASGSFLSQGEIFYNPAQSYFEFKLLLPAGTVPSNTKNVSDFSSLIDHGDLYVMIRYVAEKHIKLPVTMDEDKSVAVDHVELSGVDQINYGTQFQDVLPAHAQLIPLQQKVQLIKALYDVDVTSGDAWRYDIIKIPIHSPKS